jgi:sugar lactone lactonase YvrE
MSDPVLTVVASGLGFPEAPRWHNGEVWFTDFVTRRVQSVTAAGEVLPHAYIPGQPSGLGFLPDGGMVVVSTYDRKLIRREGDSLRVFADLAGLANSPLNDMTVTPDGIAYVGAFGLETAYRPHTETGPGMLIMVDPQGRSRVAATDLGVPNGMTVSADGRQLVVAETRAGRLTAFDIGPDGALARRRLFADCGGRFPDGIAMDAEGAIWLGSPFTEEFVRIADGGRVLETIPTPGRWAISCTFGGAGLTRLYCTTARTTRPELFNGRSEGFLEVSDVSVPGF